MVITFLPYKSFVESAKCLDFRRVGKQRVEAMQIYNIVSGKTVKKGWRNHPATLMWHGYAPALANYVNIFIDEWISRGYVNTMQKLDDSNIVLPHWMQDDETFSKVMNSHRSNLLRKNFAFYSQYRWSLTSDLQYFWPVRILAKNMYFSSDGSVEES